MDKKDEIISRQLELIRQMTERNMSHVGTDIWGTPQPQSAGVWDGKTPVTPVGKKETPVKEASGAAGGDAKKPEDDLPPKEDIADLKKELDGYIGLDAIKGEVKNLINLATVYQMRRANDLPVADISLHMVFSGNPGTGKTMIARFMARVYHSLGILSKGQLVEVDRSGLVAGFVGQTALKTAKVCEEALGGVLFIDEAYTLTSKSDNDFGFEAVDTVLKYMEDHRDDIVVIVAGYTELMEDFIASNPGLASRFNKYLDFADYTGEELAAILALQCKKNCYTLTPEAEAEVRSYLDAAASAAGEFGNARGARNFFEKILTAQANRLAGLPDVSRDMLMEITAEDVKASEEITGASLNERKA